MFAKFLAWIRKYSAHILVLLLGGAVAPRILGASGFNPNGTALIYAGPDASGPYARIESVTQGPPTLLAPGTWGKVPFSPSSADAPIPMANGGTGTFWVAISANCDGTDAGNCDGGVCSAWLEQKYCFDVHGGQCCACGGAYCAGTDAGFPVSQALVSMNTSSTTTTAPTYGDLLRVNCNAATNNVSAWAYQGANSACTFTVELSSWQQPNPTAVASSPVDSGADAADASDASDAADGSDGNFDASDGNAPTLSLMLVPMGSANGGEVVAFEGSNILSSNATGCSFGGTPGTSFSIVSSAIATCATPTSTMVASQTPITAVLTGPNGPSAPQNFYVNPPNPTAWYFGGTSAGGTWSGDWTITSTHVTVWPDQSGNGYALGVPGSGTCTAGPTIAVSSPYSGAFWTNGSHICMTSETMPCMAQPYSRAFAWVITNISTSQVFVDGTDSGALAEVYNSTPGTIKAYAGTASTGSGTVDAGGLHFINVNFNGADSGIYFSGVPVDNLNTGTGATCGLTLGAEFTGTTGAQSGELYPAAFVYPTTLPKAQEDILYANMQAVGGAM
jgi:hypothetical protein